VATVPPVPSDPDPTTTAIVVAAWVVLERAGYEGFKVERVVREARVSPRVFYRRFRNKHDLLMTLVEDSTGHVARKVAGAVALEPDPAGKVEAWMRAFLAWCGPGRAPATRLFLRELVALTEEYPDRVERVDAELRGSLIGALTRGAASGCFRPVDVAADAGAIQWVCTNLAVRSLSSPAVEPETTAAVRFVLAALRSPAAGDD
jgi:AcrR family transcriptional regulator